MNNLGALPAWLAPLRPALPGLDPGDWDLLDEFEHALAAALPSAAPDAGRRPAQLLELRGALARAGFADVCLPPAHGGRGRGLAVQGLMQFIAGFYDTDLRDATGPGHGRMIQAHASPAARAVWQPRLASGELVGIAATERHGGSRLPAITTAARRRPGGGWWLTGEKTWISRLDEAGAFVVFATIEDRGVSAALVPANAPGLLRTANRPAGLSGWSWGSLHLGEVHLREDDLIGAPGDGLRVFDEHFAVFRPLVTATALGTAAGVHTAVTGILRARVACGILTSLRDTALVRLGESHAQINAALLHTLAALRLAETGSPHAAVFSRTGKATGVATAHRAAHELPLLVGAFGFQDGHRLVKARRDLDALQLADGIGEELLRSAGRILTGTPTDTHRTDRPSDLRRDRLTEEPARA
ncbi:acyl-CoA dehydrogenase family protein [Actinospica durhamensis]|uniref:Acyl-CoA dehydrogenase family protein n=1 Tax=Actinospica durhamensis TaxID=1508375 RepID=A0A941EMW3_9ACTN|nr:acyl-CoA dehydrogenase [Actinospica durhamensis]MBR7833283.1 acyl-CoA dehydrogenase family protein [Actinospica durhamensis]